jgi:hypothetical protein
MSSRIRDVFKDILFDNCGMSPSTLGINFASVLAIESFNEELKVWHGRDLFIRIYLSKMVVMKNMGAMVFQNQSHQFGRVSDKRVTCRQVYCDVPGLEKLQ